MSYCLPAAFAKSSGEVVAALRHREYDASPPLKVRQKARRLSLTQLLTLQWAGAQPASLSSLN